MNNMSRLGALHFTKNTGAKHTATVIFFHGSGATGDHMKEWVHLLAKNFTFPHIKVLYPTAPLQPYTPAGGQMSNVWFDRVDINPNAPEALESLEKIEHDVKNLIKTENDAGIASNRIIVGGFSMGGALALHTAFRWEPNVAGVFAFSSFLNDNSIVYQELKKSTNNANVPLLQIHGDIDDLVDLTWGQTTFMELQSLGVKGEFHVMERLGHSLNKKGLNIIRDWVEKLLPEVH
ncbi:lysophospholipase-like protein 1 [Maniola jurtina]|uniref:lysophospholipase-like protein 1 n=1 Tax=Maniola jurtina TaxID=191418 RepID=UPI001E68C71E|nr:lysophospholipase-like protein 1 [Maniola jurtina]